MRVHVHATYLLKSGSIGTFSNTMEAASCEEAMALAKRRIGKHSKGKLNMTARVVPERADA